MNRKYYSNIKFLSLSNNLIRLAIETKNKNKLANFQIGMWVMDLCGLFLHIITHSNHHTFSLSHNSIITNSSHYTFKSSRLKMWWIRINGRSWELNKCFMTQLNLSSRYWTLLTKGSLSIVFEMLGSIRQVLLGLKCFLIGGLPEKKVHNCLVQE